MAKRNKLQAVSLAATLSLVIVTILTIRLRQFWRILVELGVGRSIAIGLFVLVPLFGVGKFALDEQGATVLAAGWPLLLTLVHLKRKDHAFLQLLGNTRTRLYMVEYAALSLPWIIVAFISTNWLAASVLTVFPFVVSFLPLPPSRKQRPPLPVPLVPVRAFEWRSGLRKSGIGLVLLFVASMATCWLTAAPLLGMVFMTVAISAFYDEYEQLDWVLLLSHEPKKLLLVKVRDAMLFSALFLLLPFAGAIVFHAELWLISCYVLLACFLVILFSVLTKYALYEPALEPEGKSMQTAIFLLFFLIPFLAPVNVIWLVRNGIKALTNMNEYLGKEGYREIRE